MNITKHTLLLYLTQVFNFLLFTASAGNLSITLSRRCRHFKNFYTGGRFLRESRIAFYLCIAAQALRFRRVRLPLFCGSWSAFLIKNLSCLPALFTNSTFKQFHGSKRNMLREYKPQFRRYRNFI